MKNTNRVGIITGASSGIGRNTALRIASDGFRIVLNGRNEKELDLLKQEINTKTGTETAIVIAGDVTNKETLEKCIKACYENWNVSPTLFVACAGRGLPGTLITSDEMQWENLWHINVLGLQHQLKAISQVMIAEREKGSDTETPSDIVVIGSTIGRNVSPFNSVYGATKFATHGLTEALRRELGPKGIRVTLIEPGLVSTNFQESAGYDMDWFENYCNEIGPVLVGDDVAKVVQFLVQMPGNVHLDNISIRPTRQSYP
ncbi:MULTISPECIES: SDR family oxidoreductase [Flavobacterium]|uniref:SDR family oxidoreductase n=1 Tax=Flavobacterium TaxID=237 RepID=UPI0011EDC7C6|nr:SDR family oxidoreductase [Flavobacterium johnsoniae]